MVIPVASGDPVGNTPNQGVDAVMYRGSRLTASFLLVVIGLAALAVALFVVPASAGQGIGPWPVVVSIAFAIAHFLAFVGVAGGRDWGRNGAVLLAEVGGGLAILGGVVLLTVAGSDGSAGSALVVWTGVLYAVLGIAAGRVPVLARLSAVERRRVILGPSFAGVAA